MSELFEKSMATLELPQVLALLADCAATLEGKVLKKPPDLTGAVPLS